MIELIDTHCHIHESGARTGEKATRARWAEAGNPRPADVIAEAQDAGVSNVLCIGCTLADSKGAVALAQAHDAVRASIGIHPHEAARHLEPAVQKEFAALAVQPKVVAVGECGLDYFYEHSPRADQIRLLHLQCGLAQECGLPMVFHVREAFADFWPVLDQYPGLRGVVHSFTGTRGELDEILARGLFVGQNGIVTFMKKPEQLAVVKAVPLESLLLETDSPFLTPVPYRGTICLPKHLRTTAEFLSNLRGESLETLAAATTKNARELFRF